MIIKRVFRRTLFCAGLAAGTAFGGGIGLLAADFKIGTHTFTVPAGFVVERVAGPGLVERPIVADFDEEGRLYVADSSGSNDAVEKQLAEKPHRIVRLEDGDGDGLFEKSVVFADKMMFPEGAMWLGGSLYVSAPPSIWKLTDTDGDGIADRREEWLEAKTLTHCANDLHGPYAGLDGWIYWCKGAFAEQSYERANGQEFKTRAAHIFRRRPEGGEIEAVMTGGMDNPVDVAFTPEGERIFTTTFLVNPGGGKRDGLIHAIYGGVYGKPNDAADGHKRTGELMPVLAHFGPGAPAGLARYESEAFGSEYRDNLFACQFNLHKVSRHVLKARGATYESKDSDFLVSDNPDFHPTDVIEDADGSLLVIDTGGWYKICCPTSQLWKPDVLGAIYRVRREGAKPPGDPRGRKIDWKRADGRMLAGLLGDARPAVVRQAIRELGGKAEAVTHVQASWLMNHAPQNLRNGIWALTRMEGDAARRAVRTMLRDREATARHAALHSIAARRDQGAAAEVVMLLQDENLSVRRAAAEALGRIGSAEHAAALLAAAGNPAASQGADADRVLEHSIIYALIELNAPAATRAGLSSANARTKRAALVALDQMEGGGLKAAEVIPLLTSADAVLKETADWIVLHRGDWGVELAGYFGGRMRTEELGGLRGPLAANAAAGEIQKLLAEVAGSGAEPTGARNLALQAMRDARLKETPAGWTDAVERALGNEMLAGEAAETAGAFPFKETPAGLRGALLAAARNVKLAAETRLRALGSIGGGLELDGPLFDFARGQLTPENPAGARARAAGLLARAKLGESQLLALCENVRKAGPVEISALLGAFENRTDEKTGRALLASLRDSPGLAGLHPDRVKQVLLNSPEAVKAEAAPILARLNQDAAAQAARIDELLPKLKNGDIRRGQAIFNSTRAACASCHAIGYLGGKLGPDLTRIGQVRNERDLLEAIVYPSASLVRSFEPLIVTTRDGEEYTGIPRRDNAEGVVLAMGPDAEMNFARADVASARPGVVSVMPPGLGEQLTEGELADLLAFLKATRW